MKAKKLDTKTQIGIGIFSSSSPISSTTPVRYVNGKKYLEEKGYNIIDGSLFRKKDFYRSGSICERAKEFNELLYRDDVQILMSSIGGNNTNSILPYIDYEYLRKHPKMIVRYNSAVVSNLCKNRISNILWTGVGGFFRRISSVCRYDI